MLRLLMTKAITDSTSSNMLFPILKAVRFVRIYGLPRTVTKVLARTRVPFVTIGRRGRAAIAVVGCGQFAFATIAYYLQRVFGACISSCYDVNRNAARSFARFYRVPRIAESFPQLLSESDFSVLYISSNHASHAEYAIQALRAGRTVYIEKPVSVNRRQLKNLAKVRRQIECSLFAGYNRPFSKAVRDLRKVCTETSSPLTFACFVSGHQLGRDHWYRKPEEGTRICGNVGHWLDLAVHLLCWGELPECWHVTLAWANNETRDEDLAISLTSERGDLVSIVLTARTEPFEGINETINLQWGSTIAKIDDFRQMTIWKGPHLQRFRYRPKDVGHKEAILQPFRESARSWHEVELSSLLMLRIAEMVVEGERAFTFSFATEWAELGVEEIGAQLA